MKAKQVTFDVRDKKITVSESEALALIFQISQILLANKSAKKAVDFDFRQIGEGYANRGKYIGG